MSAPMTLEALRGFMRSVVDGGELWDKPCDDAFDVLIRERDGNRDSLREHMHLLKDAIRERDALRAYHEHMETTDQSAIVDGAGNVRYVNVEVYNAMRDRAEKAEAELAALKKRIAGSRAQLVSVLCDADGRPCVDGSDEDRVIIDGALRLLVEGRRKTDALLPCDPPKVRQRFKLESIDVYLSRGGPDPRPIISE